MHRTLLVAGLLLATLLAGCSGDDKVHTPEPVTGVTSVFDRAALPFNVTDVWSHTLEAGVYGILGVQSVFVDVPLDPTEGGAALEPDGAQIHLGLWLPDVPAGTKVPVIADVGPYYGDGDVPADQRGSGRLGEFLISNFVPHGYAVAQVSVTGTGQSDHCMNMMGSAEQAGIHAAVEWLGTQDWSNGNVGLIGRSYDGSTPWEAAAMGSDHLKTIVPISGLTGIPELMFNNGAPETRTLTFHNVVYGTFAVDSDPTTGNVDFGDVGNLCPDYLASSAFQTGEVVAQGDIGNNPYFAERRFFQRALENYAGSVYLIHGLQDWNVDPHTAMPFYPQMAAAWETKALFGQWDHAYPDRPGDHSDLTPGRGAEAGNRTVRYDWAQDLLEWFDHYLMGTGPAPELHVEIQDHLGNWRVESAWPPVDAEHTVLEFSDATGPASLSISGSLQTAGSSNPQTAGATGPGEYLFAPISETDDVILTGIPVVKAALSVIEPRGLLYVELHDAVDGTRLGHGVMDIRYHGGTDQADGLTPGDNVEAKLHMEAMEAYLPAGHGLRVLVGGTGEGYVLGMNEVPYTFTAAGSSLHLDVRPVSEAAFFLPPAW